MRTVTHGHTKTKTIPNQYPHGTAMGSPCVGPQERPKSEYAQDYVISNEERNPTRPNDTHGVAMGYYDATLPGLWGIGCSPKGRDDKDETIRNIRAGTPVVTDKTKKHDTNPPTA